MHDADGKAAGAEDSSFISDVVVYIVSQCAGLTLSYTGMIMMPLTASSCHCVVALHLFSCKRPEHSKPAWSVVKQLDSRKKDIVFCSKWEKEWLFRRQIIVNEAVSVWVLTKSAVVLYCVHLSQCRIRRWSSEICLLWDLPYSYNLLHHNFFLKLSQIHVTIKQTEQSFNVSYHGFIARDSIYAKRAYAIAIPSVCPSVRPSVRPSVCLSVCHTGDSCKNGCS